MPCSRQDRLFDGFHAGRHTIRRSVRVEPVQPVEQAEQAQPATQAMSGTASLGQLPSERELHLTEETPDTASGLESLPQQSHIRAVTLPRGSESTPRRSGRRVRGPERFVP